jgi:hypothetical protein
MFLGSLTAVKAVGLNAKGFCQSPQYVAVYISKLMKEIVLGGVSDVSLSELWIRLGLVDLGC